MNANQLISMVIRMVMKRLMRQGVNAGIEAVGKRMSRGKSPDQPEQNINTAETEKRMRQTVRMTRKIGRF